MVEGGLLAVDIRGGPRPGAAESAGGLRADVAERLDALLAVLDAKSLDDLPL